jgi:acyl carrier protein
VPEAVTILARPRTEYVSASAPDVAAALLQIVREVVGELHPGRVSVDTDLDSRLDRDLGIDSLGRAELVARIERTFAVTLPVHTLAEAETPRDLLAALLAHRQTAVPLSLPPRRMPAAPTAAPEPIEAQTLCSAVSVG